MSNFLNLRRDVYEPQRLTFSDLRVCVFEPGFWSFLTCINMKEKPSKTETYPSSWFTYSWFCDLRFTKAERQWRQQICNWSGMRLLILVTYVSIISNRKMQLKVQESNCNRAQLRRRMLRIRCTYKMYDVRIWHIFYRIKQDLTENSKSHVRNRVNRICVLNWLQRM